MFSESLLTLIKKTQTRVLNLGLATIIGLSGLAGAIPFMSARAYAASTLQVSQAVGAADTGDCIAAPCLTLNYAISQAVAGDTVSVAAGTYSANEFLILANKAGITVRGEGVDQTTLNLTAVSDGLKVQANNVTLKNFTLTTAHVAKYGLRAQNISGLDVQNVKITNMVKSAFDINGVSNSSFSGLTAQNNGGNGVSITDSNHLSFDGVTTDGNSWGGIALYATGTSYPCGVNNISMSNLSLAETVALYTGIDTPSNPACVITTLTLPTYLPYKVTLNQGDPQDIYVKSLADASVVASASPSLAPIARSTSDGSYWVTSGFKIQDAVNSATAGSTVHVTDNYSGAGVVSVNKSLNILGARAGVDARTRSGSESVLSSVSISSSNVTVEGFSFNGSGTQVTASGATTLSGVILRNNIFSGYGTVGIVTDSAGDILIKQNRFNGPATTGEPMQLKANFHAGGCNGTKVLDNLFQNATNNGSADVNFSCSGSASSSITVSGNTSLNGSDTSGSSFVALSGVSNIQVTNNRALTDGSTVFVFGSVSGTALIDGNDFSGSTNIDPAISIHGGEYSTDVPNTGTFTITNNNLSGHPKAITVATVGLGVGGHVVAHGNNLSSTIGIDNASSTTLDATSNWWGSATPVFASVIHGNVTHDPYFTNAAMTTRSDAKVLPDNNGNATADSTTPQVVVTSSSQPVSITVANGTNNASVDYGSLVTSGTGTIPQTTVHTAGADISIPASTTVIANDTSWNGVISAPTVQSNASVTVPTPGGTTTTVGTVIEVGAGNIGLTFNKAVRLFIPGQANKLVGFVRNGNFTQITSVCSADDQALEDIALATGGDCYMNAGADLVVWTKHFTTFVAYSQNVNPTSGSGSSSQATGTGSSNHAATASASTPQNTAVEVLGTSTEGGVIGTALSTTKAPAAIAKTVNNHKFAGISWYLWLVGLAVLAGATYFAHLRADSTDKK
ncbi:MAG: hypothetical protein JWO96_507 [Candidatus Saccharibacteria bacterium]|nr:hypothetical protein [Candidatus Saccharibacteria bacterium]